MLFPFLSTRIIGKKGDGLMRITVDNNDIAQIPPHGCQNTVLDRLISQGRISCSKGLSKVTP